MAPEAAILRATEDDVREFAQRRWRDAPSQRLYAYLAENATGGAWTARDAQTSVGIGFLHGNSDERYISELYVEPAFRNQGIGSALYRQLVNDDSIGASAALVATDETSGIAFSLRHGIALRTPIVRVCGTIPPEEDLAGLAYGAYRFHVLPIDLHAHGNEIDALDRAVRGNARLDDHRMFLSMANGSAIFLEGEFIGYVYAWPDGRVGPIATASAAYIAQCFAFGLVTLRRELGATWCSAGVPGENLRVMRAALQVGLKIDSMRLFASEVSSGDLRRYVGYHPLLF